MKKAQKKKILKIQGKIDSLKELLSSVVEDVEKYHSKKSGSWADSEKGLLSFDYLSNAIEAVSYLESASFSLGNIAIDDD